MDDCSFAPNRMTHDCRKGNGGGSGRWEEKDRGLVLGRDKFGIQAKGRSHTCYNTRLGLVERHFGPRKGRLRIKLRRDVTQIGQVNKDASSRGEQANHEWN